MLHEESLITSLFKILNVIVLCGVGFYFFKTRVLSMIRDMIAQKKQEEKSLQNEKRSLKSKLKTIEDEIIEQQVLCAHIKENVGKWREVVAEEQKMVEREEQTRIVDQEKRVMRQSEYLAALKLQQKVLPQALENAKRELEEQFTPQRGYEYLQHTIRYMRKA